MRLTPAASPRIHQLQWVTGTHAPASRFPSPRPFDSGIYKTTTGHLSSRTHPLGTKVLSFTQTGNYRGATRPTGLLDAARSPSPSQRRYTAVHSGPYHSISGTPQLPCSNVRCGGQCVHICHASRPPAVRLRGSGSTGKSLEKLKRRSGSYRT